MRRLTTHLICLVLPLFFQAQLSAFEGIIDYEIDSGDRIWKVECLIKGDLIKAKVYLGSTHYQSVMQNSEGMYVIDELNKHVFPSAMERTRWGRKDDLEKKARVLKDNYEESGTFESDNVSGDVYQVKHDRKTYTMEVFGGKAGMPFVFFDQFSSLRPMYFAASGVFQENRLLPHRIFRKGKSKKPILAYKGSRESAIDDQEFVISDDYIRAKMKFRSR